MNDFVLVCGNRNYSSWSMRAWLALRFAGVEFEERRVAIEEDPDRSQRLAYGPTGKVPVLLHGELAVWDSLAIGEYLAELFPGASLWPAERSDRARARSLCAEMHAGFEAVRGRMPMNCRARKPAADRGQEVAREVARLQAMWSETRAAFGRGGRYLFGDRGLADAFFAPVASRFHTYSVALSGAAADYAAALLDDPDVAAWMRDAATEAGTMPDYDAMV